MESTDIDPKWRKASYSGGANGSCVEVGHGNGVLVRDTTDRDGGTLTFTPSVWRAFTSGIKRLASIHRRFRWLYGRGNAKGAL